MYLLVTPCTLKIAEKLTRVSINCNQSVALTGSLPRLVYIRASDFLERYIILIYRSAETKICARFVGNAREGLGRGPPKNMPTCHPCTLTPCQGNITEEIHPQTGWRTINCHDGGMLQTQGSWKKNKLVRV